MVRDMETTTPAIAFFHEHAGWSYDPLVETSEQGRERCARLLAMAEDVANDLDWYYTIEDDWDVLEDDAGSVELVASGEMRNLMVTLYNEQGDILAAIGGVVVPSEDDDYVRVIKAELAYEIIGPPED